MRFDERGIHLQQVKEYLAQARYLDADINSRQQELDMTRKNLMSLQGQELKQDVVQSSRAGHYDDKFNLLFEISDTINSKIDKLVALKQDISMRIDRLDDRVYVIILRERYINMLEFHQIANRLNQSERHITRMHGQALVDFYACNQDLFKTCPKMS